MDRDARVRLKRLAILVGTATFFVIILAVFREVLVPFVVAVVLAYVFSPAVEWLHRRSVARWRPPRWLAVLALYAVLFGVIGVLGTTIVPRIGYETAALVRAAPEFFNRARDAWVPSLEARLGEYLGGFVAPPLSIVPEELGEEALPECEPLPPPRPVESVRAPARPRVEEGGVQRRDAGATPPASSTVPDGGLPARARPATAGVAADAAVAAGGAAAPSDAGAAVAARNQPDGARPGSDGAPPAEAGGDAPPATVAAVEVARRAEGVTVGEPPRREEPTGAAAAPAPNENIAFEQAPSVEERRPATSAGGAVAEISDPQRDVRECIPRDGPRHPPPALRVVPSKRGGYDIILSGDGLVVEELDDGRYRIGGGRSPEAGGLGLQRQIDDAIDRVLAQGEQHALSALRWTQRALFITVEVIFEAVLSLMLAAFLLATSPTVMAFFRSLFPPRLRDDFDQVVKRVDGGLSGVIRGQLMICLINGVLSGVGFAIAGLRYWPLLTLLATVASLVPIFGTIVSSIPAVAIGLSQGWGTGIFVLIWIVAIHELEANVLNPKIMGDAAKMHPVIVVFALLAGANAAGVLGALLGVPVASILQSLFRFLRARAYEEDESAEECAEAGGEGGAPGPGPLSPP